MQRNAKKKTYTHKKSTTNRNEIGTTSVGQIGKHGYKSEGIAGYCYPRRLRGTIALHRYYNAITKDHF